MSTLTPPSAVATLSRPARHWSKSSASMCALNAIRFIRASRKLLIAVVVSTGSPSVLVAALGPKNKAYASSMINTIKKAPEAYALGAFFMLWLWSQPALSHCPADAEAPRERAQVAHIIDGATVRLQDGRRVRFLGVNAREAGREDRKSVV